MTIVGIIDKVQDGQSIAYGKLMHARVISVSPDMAQRMLDSSVGNRKIRQAAVQTYLSDMKDGRWRLTHQGVAMDTNGHLIDGHHRLEALVRFGRPLKMFVVYNVPTDGKMNIDTNRVRSVSDILKFMNVEQRDSGKVTAVARCIEHLPSTMKRMPPYSTEQCIRLLEFHKDAILYAHDAFGYGSGMCAGAKAALAKAYYYYLDRGNVERLDEFCASFRAMTIRNAETDSAVPTLIRYAQSSKKMNGSHARFERYCRCQSAIKYFMERQPMSKLYGTREDLFPLSEDRCLY